MFDIKNVIYYQNICVFIFFSLFLVDKLAYNGLFNH